jgi:hypothetical protein
MKEKSVVEEALLQIKSVENAISENAKGILASTMKEEISELVRESLNVPKKRKLREQEEDQEVDVDTEVEDVEEPEMEEPEMEEPEMEDEVEVDAEVEGDQPTDELPPLDMTQAPMSDVMKVFKLMGDEDGVIVKKDETGIHLSDPNNNTEYLIQLGDESNNPEHMMENYMEEGEWNEDNSYMEPTENIYELEVDGENPFGEEETFEMYEEDSMVGGFGEESEIEPSMYEEDQTFYEIDQDTLESVLESFKAKGTGMGKPKLGMPKSGVNMKGFKEDRKSGGRGMTGKGPKFKYPSIKHGVTETEMDEEEFNEWEEENNEGLVDSVENLDAETTEASRTMTYRRRAERGRVTAPRQVSESQYKQVELLKEKNEEYKKALDFFRTKLNEVAVFNSNLAYSTRLFTEHSTTKQEKINILRRFDSVETLKESKNLYQSIKKELGGKESQPIVTESIERKVIKTPQTGSATNLIESKTYENPQFLRMRDLMAKIK